MQNAADALGVTLGEYYAEDVELEELSGEAIGADRLDAAREELLVHIDGLAKGRRVRVRRMRVAVLSTASFIFVGIAVWGGLSLDGRGDVKRVETTNAINRIPPSMRGKGAPAPIGTSVVSRLRADGLTIANSTYVDQEGDVCSVLSYETRGISERRSGGGCLSPANLAASLLRERAFAKSVVSTERHLLLQGYASTDLRQIVPEQSRQGIDVLVSRPWMPLLKDHIRGPRIRSFMIRIPLSRPADMLAVLRRSKFVATFSGGVVVRVGGLLGLGSGASPRRSRLVDPVLGSKPAHSYQDQNHRSGVDMAMPAMYSAYRQMEGVVDSGGRRP